MSETNGAKPMSAFERRRLENRQANTELIHELSTVAKSVIPAAPPPSSKPSRSKRKEPPPPREPSKRTRASARLAGIEAESDVKKLKFEEEMENEKEKQRAKRMRVSGDLALGSIGVDGKKWENDVEGLKDIFRGAQPGYRTFTEEDIKETTDKDLKALRERLGGLKLYEKWLPNGTYQALTARISFYADNRTCRYQNYAAARV